MPENSNTKTVAPFMEHLRYRQMEISRSNGNSSKRWLCKISTKAWNRKNSLMK
nr:MAG TPA: hypothetical protein [Bacteriophage sp.]